MGKPKKQHYVPQFLLKNFTTGHNSKATVWVLDKRNEKVYESSVRDVAHENQFYEYHGEAGDIEAEELMQKIDSKGAGIIARIISNCKLPSSDEDRIWLSYFISTQMFRTPMTRNDMENFRQTIIHKWGPDIRVSPDDPKTVGEYGPQDAKLSSLMVFRDVPEFAKLLQGKVWILDEASRMPQYVISDNAVAMHNMVERRGRGNLGLRNDGIEVYMPLSPKLTFHAICPILANAALKTPELSVSFSHALMEGAPMVNAPQNVEFVNSLQVIWAERFVYAKDRSDLDMPLDMLRTNPELKDGPGVRPKPEDV